MKRKISITRPTQRLYNQVDSEKQKQFEFLSKLCFVIYVSLSNVHSTSFPHRSCLADFLFDSSIQSLEEVKARFHAYFYVYMNYLRDKQLADSTQKYS
jgi:hypothetical protein